jgi:hypothetical protein
LEAGRDGGTKKVKKKTKPLRVDDLEQDEDGCGQYQPLKTNSEGADRGPSRTGSGSGGGGGDGDDGGTSSGSGRGDDSSHSSQLLAERAPAAVLAAGCLWCTPYT